MKSYTRGSPTCSVLVRNVAEAIDEDDLRSVFAFVLPADSKVQYVIIGLMLQSTRMTDSVAGNRSIQVNLSAPSQSATVVYPTIEMATAAIDQLHGVVMKGRPLVVVGPGPIAPCKKNLALHDT